MHGRAWLCPWGGLLPVLSGARHGTASKGGSVARHMTPCHPAGGRKHPVLRRALMPDFCRSRWGAGSEQVFEQPGVATQQQPCQTALALSITQVRVSGTSCTRNKTAQIPRCPPQQGALGADSQAGGSVAEGDGESLLGAGLQHGGDAQAPAQQLVRHLQEAVLSMEPNQGPPRADAG